jgi:hypothetical protein
LFEPRREHARFCSARCRVAWNRENAGDRAAGGTALAWSVTAMHDATTRLHTTPAHDRSRAAALISEAVWWVTIVDGTLVRYHPDGYDTILATQPHRDLIEGTLAGLRYVRNQAGQHADHTDFIAPHPPPDGHLAHWHWASVPAPALTTLPPRGQAWETARYHDYEACLAGHTIAATFTTATDFLNQAATCATTADPQARAIQGSMG